MKIDLWHDPVFVDTKVCIDGCWQDTGDIYGFLYPVLHYPLQTWIRENGSWKGLHKQIEELARGEDTELEFHGRAVDYADLSGEFAGKSRIRLTFEVWDMEKTYCGRLDEAKKLYVGIAGKISGLPAAVLSPEDGQMELDFQDSIDGSFLRDKWKELDSWCCIIDDEGKFAQAQKSSLPCIYMKDTVLSSYDNLARTEKLTQSLKRPSDAVFSAVEDADKRNELIRYCALFPGMKFSHFTGLADENLQKLYLKYGYPYMLRQYLHTMGGIAELLIKELDKGGDIKREIQDISQEIQKGRPIDEKRLRFLNEKKMWIDRNKESVEKLAELTRHAVDELGGE